MYQDRAAHIASVQLPLVVALAGKNNVISCMSLSFPFILNIDIGPRADRCWS